MVDGVTKQYELSSSWAVLNDIITSNVSDPLTGTNARSSTSDWIFNGFPNPIKFAERDGWVFPILVIRIPDLSESADTRVMDDSKVLSTVSVDIEAHGKTRQEAELLAESARWQLYSNLSELNKACLFRMTLTGTANDVDFIGSNKYYTKTFSFDFMRFD